MQQINDLEKTEACKETRRNILQRIEKTQYETWFKNKVILTEEDDLVVVNISTKPSLFAYDYITARRVIPLKLYHTPRASSCDSYMSH